MNEIELSEAHEMIGTTLDLILSKKVWDVQPLGHTDFQIRRFILNDKEYPRGVPKFRQAVRELWTRIEAYYQVKDRLDDLEVDELTARAELSEAQHQKAWWPWTKLRREARMLKAKHILARIIRIRSLLHFEIRERIMRETMVLLYEAKKQDIPGIVQAFSEEDAKMWQERAKESDRLKEMLESGIDGKAH